MSTQQNDLLADKSGELLNQAEHLHDTRDYHSTTQTLDLVQILRMIEATAGSATRTAVHEARDQRATWSELGRVLDTSAQAAQQRYAHSPRTRPHSASSSATSA